MVPSPDEEEARTEIDVPDAACFKMALMALLICADSPPPSEASKKVSGTQSWSESHSGLLVLLPVPRFEPAGKVQVWVPDKATALSPFKSLNPPYLEADDNNVAPAGPPMALTEYKLTYCVSARSLRKSCVRP